MKKKINLVKKIAEIIAKDEAEARDKKIFGFNPKKEIKWEKEFDEKFLSNVRTGNEMMGFWWVLNTTDPEDIKSFIRHLLEEELQKAKIQGVEELLKAGYIIGKREGGAFKEEDLNSLKIS